MVKKNAGSTLASRIKKINTSALNKLKPRSNKNHSCKLCKRKKSNIKCSHSLCLNCCRFSQKHCKLSLHDNLCRKPKNQTKITQFFRPASAQVDKETKPVQRKAKKEEESYSPTKASEKSRFAPVEPHPEHLPYVVTKGSSHKAMFSYRVTPRQLQLSFGLSIPAICINAPYQSTRPVALDRVQRRVYSPSRNLEKN
eukprot:TRINITY_DN3006_c0_g1_i1.p1 TRINITY_DN3006_c0_g1~~TRINITY_DN3006_c0_g1_i1.p1  ORF type:complete len:197 (-),score=12.02 TRINITY_DN3006_c0_g1_i1:189-779(-)